MKTPPPLRHYQQMVRVVREQERSKYRSTTPYKLATAYSTESDTPTMTRERSLDEIGINSRTTRQPESESFNGCLSNRENTVLYHQLAASQQQYFTGRHSDTQPFRQDNLAGTKSRAFLSADDHTFPAHSRVQCQAVSDPLKPAGYSVSALSNVVRQTALPSSSVGHQSALTTASEPNFVSSGYSNSELRILGTIAEKQTRLPIVGSLSLEGIRGNSLQFSLTF